MVSDDPSGLDRRTMRASSSALRLGVPVRTRCAPDTSPTGSAATSAAIAVAISAIVTS
jgi:hypothetical protein